MSVAVATVIAVLLHTAHATVSLELTPGVPISGVLAPNALVLHRTSQPVHRLARHRRAHRSCQQPAADFRVRERRRGGLHGV
jgi:hypothetical protein